MGPSAAEWHPPPDPPPPPAPEYEIRLRRTSRTMHRKRDGFPSFPYAAPLTTFIQITGAKLILQATTVETKLQAVGQVKADGGILIAVWTGGGRSDAFWVDVLDEALWALLEAQKGSS